MIRVSKAHAYWNDILFVPASDGGADLAALARTMCDRHHGIGADGLIVYELRTGGAAMQLLNADGSPSELSGNGMRCLAALVARTDRVPSGATITIDTDAGIKTLEMLARDGERYTFRAAMGHPEELRQVEIPVGSEAIAASVLRIGNPQCVVLGRLPDAERFNRIAPALSAHSMFPQGDQRRVCPRRSARPSTDPDLGTWSRTDDVIRNWVIGLGRGRGCAWGRVTDDGRRGAGGYSARRVA